MTPQIGHNPLAGLRNDGQPVPVVAFYSVQGGVGKSTLARKFAELMTLAPGHVIGRKPNVLLIDLDVEAQGLTYRLTEGLHQNYRTVHEVIAQRDISVIQAIDVTDKVSLASGNPTDRGKLYLMPAAPPEAKRLFDTISEIDKPELLAILANLIIALCNHYHIACVVIDCAPGANPYTAAAATLADVPFLIGRNEKATYNQIRMLPERFREMYSQFVPANQKVIINAVSVKEILSENLKQHTIFDSIPLTSAVIHETEGLQSPETMRMLLFEKYLVDIIQKSLLGRVDLIPTAPEILGAEYVGTLAKLERADEAPKMRFLAKLSYLRWIGAVLVLVGVALLLSPKMFHHVADLLETAGISSVIAGIALAAAGWYSDSERHRIREAARALVDGGAEGMFQGLKTSTPSFRAQLEAMKKLAETIPKHPTPRR